MLGIATGIALVVFGLGILLWLALSPSAPVEIGRRGIRDHGLGWGWIPWDAIEGVYPPTSDDTSGLRLRLRPTGRLERAIRRRPRRAARPCSDTVEVRLELADSGPSPLELLQEILERDLAPPTLGESPRNPTVEDNPSA